MTDTTRPFTASALARITIRVAASSDLLKAEVPQTFEISFGRMRDIYKDLIALGTDPALRSYWPFTDQEWEVIRNLEGVWQAMHAELGMHDVVSRRIRVPRGAIPFDEWSKDMTASIPHTLCFGIAMKSFGFQKKPA